jgi:hypothetical protein
MKTLLSFLKSGLLSTILAILVMVSGYFFLKEYGFCLAQTEKLETLNVRLGISKNQLQEATRKQRIFFRVQTFLNHANALGLHEKKWATYNVNIEEPVTFDAFDQILEQCNQTPLFYFNPISLQITTAMDTEQNKNKNPNESNRSALPKEKDGDILINLKGSFIVRDKL